MNLKEAFHYQNVLDKWMSNAGFILGNRANSYKITKNHLYSKADETREDVLEDVERTSDVSNDDVIKFMSALIEEKILLNDAITAAELKAPINFKAAIAANKYRNGMINSLRYMLQNKTKKSVEKGIAYKFNNEGNQTSYAYDVEVTYEEAYDRKSAKELLKKLEAERSATATQIESAQVNAVLAFTPRFDENDSVEDIVLEFVK